MMTAQKGLFEKEICDFLIENGFNFTISKINESQFLSNQFPGDKEELSFTCLSVSLQNNTNDILLKIILVPLIARSMEEAEKQQKILYTLKDKDYIFLCEDRWYATPEVIRQRLLAHLGKFESVFARKCIVQKIDKKKAEAFLNRFHSYGYANAKYSFALLSKESENSNFESEEILAVALFSSARNWKKGDKMIRSYEWVRYACKANIRLIGGMGKILSAFIAAVKPDDIMTYADLEWSLGRAYSKLGFTLEDESKAPVCFLIDPLSYKRTAIKISGNPDNINLNLKGKMQEELLKNCFYYKNLGSRKYRLKLTEY